MRYSDVFYKKSSRILLGTAYFGDGISEKDAFEIMCRTNGKLGNDGIYIQRLI